jgi:hypothetical protein
MATVRNVGLVAVGVDVTGVLEKLDGAASGATRIADWLRGQERFGVKPFIEELTDAKETKVSARKVQDAVKALTDRGDLDLLILYFAGHGIVKSGGDELVLLSEVGTYKDEAIAIASTMTNARYSKVPHVIVISDACRNAVDPFSKLGTVSGKPALERGPVMGTKKSKVDEFYATEPSQTAKEVNREGLFTEVLLQGLTQPPLTVWEVWPDLDPGVGVVPAWKLESYLEVEVPLRAASHKPPFSQTPDSTTTSRQPLFFGYVDATSTTRAGPISVDGARSAALREMTLRQDALQGINSVLTSTSEGLDAAMIADAGLDGEFQAYYLRSEHGRSAFETYTGYSVIGGKVEKVMLSGGRGDELLDSGEGERGQDVCLYPPPFASDTDAHRGSVALFFASGTVCILPILPGYIGTLHLVDGRVASLSFDLSAQLRDRFNEDEKEHRTSAERRALAAALSASGKLRWLARGEGVAHAAFLRQRERLDPTLGIYAAYASALSGDDRGARSVRRWFRDCPSPDPTIGLPRTPVPFDVVMLARGLSTKAAARTPGFAPFCPMMTLGWSLLPSYVDPEVLHPAIVEAGKNRLNAEWTTFRQQDVMPMLDAFERGELK